MRTPLLGRMTEQQWLINIHQLGYPTLVYIYFMTNDEIDGTNGHVQNSSVWKFPPNLESFDLTYQGNSLLPSGEVTKLDLPATDTMSKLCFFEHQANFRRDAGTYESFFDDGTGQYIVVDLRDLYLQQHQKLSELDHMTFSMKFNNNLSPNNYQIGMFALTEKKFVMKTNNEHGVVNAAGKPQISG